MVSHYAKRIGVLVVGCLLAQFAMASSAAPEYKTSAEHYAALRAKAGNPKPIGWSKLPDWSGVWRTGNKNSFDGINDFVNTPTGAPLNPEYAAKYAQTLANSRNGIRYDQTTSCIPAGFPRMHVEPYLKEFVLTPARTMLMAELSNETRRIFTDGRGHVAEDDAYPMWEGDSIGFWDRDTLVVHTTNLRADPKGYQREGPPQSDQLTTVERIRKVGPDEIVSEMTLYDPVTMTRPWHVAHHFLRVTDLPDARIEQWVCEDNKYEASPDGGTKFVDKP